MDSSTTHTEVHLGPLPPGWISDTNVMDPIWKPLHLSGVNHFAFAGPVSPNQYASRSDPSSPAYQAWMGVYAVRGGSDLFSTKNSSAEFAWLSRLAVLDQESWLGAMGDPHPEAEWIDKPAEQFVEIDHARRSTYYLVMTTHSDLSSPGPNSSPLSKSIGMPPTVASGLLVKPFHPITLRGIYSFWYVSRRDKTFVVYAVSSAFRATDGTVHDNYAQLLPSLDAFVRGARIESVPH